ncbi:MAG: DUF3726 domain-containing protein [Gammaproteobacteria bacterium]|nr:DUF3726 domain-containing protein [Gammaproteobacteria bacterium]
MKVSRNELTSLIKQALEGCGLAQGNYESAAAAMVWAQMLELSPFTDVDISLQQCADMRQAQIQLTPTSEQACEIKLVGQVGGARGVTALLWGQSVSDLIEAQMLHNGVCVATICNVRDPLLGVKPMQDAQAKGLWCFAYGANPGCPDIITHVRAQANQPATEIIQYQLLGGDTMSTTELTVVYTQSEAEYRRQLGLHDHANIENVIEQITPQQMQTNYDGSLSEGIEFPEPLFQRLTHLAANVLVESSAQSRRGAGA